jgi:hypothetical protein
MRQTLILIPVLLCLKISSADNQSLTQILRGKIVDKDSGLPIIGANLVINDLSPMVGTSTNSEGEFQFQPLRVGRYDITVQCIGYEPKVVSNILLKAGKESELTIFLTESVVNIEEVTVSAKKHKGEPLNKMALISARSFSVQETNRYAGSFDDPARMASSFAGVMGSPDGNNDIIIRGNSPRGMLWRMEGIEIPNPNHFAEEGASGGAISALNSKMLDNSDFYTGAFPSEYGNAYSGVFDLRLRNGNKHKREYSVMAGLLGTDITAEGPFWKGGSVSYLVNYRYSSVAMLNAIGIKVAGDAVPDFQNCSFKLNLPTKKYGTFNLFGLGGLSGIKEDLDDYKNDFNTDMVAVGLSHTIPLDDQTVLKTVVAFTGSRNTWEYRDSIAPGEYRLEGKENIRYSNLGTSLSLNRKISAIHSFKTGVTFTKRYYNVLGRDWDEDEDYLETEVDRKGNTETFQSYFSWKYRLAQKLTLISGIHYTYLFLNDNNSLEPRISLRWEMSEKQSLNFGFGVHSKIETLTNYLAEQVDEQSNTIYPNENLDFSKARHYVIGYDRMLNNDLMLKIEAYYQYLYNVPVEDDLQSTYSVLNYSYGYSNEKLVNKGTGENYGIDLTLEKFFSKNYYFLTTASLFDSKYKAMDGIERNTMYNTNFLFNMLAGNEWQIKSNDIESTLAASVRIIWNGGNHYTPIDVAASKEHGYTKYFEDRAFSAQRNDFLRLDLKLQYRKNKKKTTRIWELDIQNVTNQANVIRQYWDEDTQRVEDTCQLGFLPVLSYRIEF